MDIANKQENVTTFEEMAEVVARLGIVPLAGLIPEHPSVNGLTLAENWHTDTELDPWRWRVRFPGEGLAGYGKFIKKKAVLISREWLPAYLAAAGPQRSLEERYKSGQATREALTLLEIIRANEGIETRQLRSMADMKAKEKKTAFDNAVTELQGSLDIVISGVKQRVNAAGEPNGWNSTSYETTGHWMQEAGISPFAGSRDEALVWLRGRMEEAWAPEAIAWTTKVVGWK